MSNVIDAIENALGAALKPGQVAHYDPTPTDLRRVAEAVEEYYAKAALPGKDEWHLRPLMTASSTAGRKLGLSYTFDGSHYDSQWRYNYNPAVSGEMVQQVKRYLLYCHSLCITDALSYLLDYFRLDPRSEHALRRRPAVLALLDEYAKVGKLIKKQILIPVSGSTMLGGPTELQDVDLTQGDGEKLRYRLPGYDLEELRIMANYIHDEQNLITRLNHRVDLFLPSLRFVDVLRNLLVISQTSFTSRDILEPFNASLFGSLPLINPEAVSIADLIRIRNDDDMFNDWRTILTEALKQLHSSPQNFTDLNGQFSVNVREQVQLWKDRLERRGRESSFTAQLIQGAGKMALGAIGGALTGSLFGGPDNLFGPVAAGAVGALIPAGVELIRDLARTALKKPGVTTLRHHFLAVGIEPPL